MKGSTDSVLGDLDACAIVGVKIQVILFAILTLCLAGCGKKCETYEGERLAICMKCFPRSTVIICIPCRAEDNVEHCQPYCEECVGHNIVKMTQWELYERRRKLGYK